MDQTAKLEWGLFPIPDGEYLAIWGARAILEDGRIILLPDRQQMLGNLDTKDILCRWINHTGLPNLKHHIKTNCWNGSTEDIFILDLWPFQLRASPRRSHGYLYLTAVIQGEEKFPNGKWSNTFIPAIGEMIQATINGLGQCRVLGYWKEYDWNAVIVKPLRPPEWFVRQRGRDAVCMLFGAEFTRCNHA